MSNHEKTYYLGLDIGTDSVGYAVTNEKYELQKYHGEPVWGVTTFEAANLAGERRMQRTARRRIDRRQQRVDLVSEIFARDITAVDPDFFIRRKESALFAEDTKSGVRIFNDPQQERAYHKKYPTIHHLIFELMNSDTPHDIREVYLACAWLVAHRGHFLYDTSEDKVGDFSDCYREMCEYFSETVQCQLPWDGKVQPDTVLQIMQMQTGVTRKQALFAEKVYGGKKLSKQKDDNFPYSRDTIVKLLSGGKAAPKELFCQDAYASVESVSLGMDEDNFGRILAELDEDAELLRVLRKMYDCALLISAQNGKSCISEAKIAVYEQHKADLAWLKYFMKTYKKNKYYQVFRSEDAGTYTAYSGNVKSCKSPEKVKKVKKEVFSENLTKIVKETAVKPKDQKKYDDMMERLKLQTFLPKQRDGDNRVIPQQLYYAELSTILEKAVRYLPMLSEQDAAGISNAEKIRSVFQFRIPYFVGPLVKRNDNAWIVRSSEKIYPWNFETVVDLDASEEGFIRKMTNKCTYLPGEDVLPVNSLLYSRFMVLNEINNLKINQNAIPVAVKQELYSELFEAKARKITKTVIENYLRSRGLMGPGDELSGIDDTVKASLKSFHSFKRMLSDGILTEEQAEDIICHAAYSEDRSRMLRWLGNSFPQLTKEDRNYILRLNLKEFGRLSAKLLTGLYHVDPDTGEAETIMDLLWSTNCNLMQLLSDKYSFQDQIAEAAADYYASGKRKLSDRLDEMYISNAVKRPIFRTMDIVHDVQKAMGGAPAKIFVEMARGATAEQQGRRTVSRRQQILDLYKSVKTEEARRLTAELEAMGAEADNRLQGDRLFLYYMQMGKCMYTGAPIDLSQLAGDTYDIDHIYPQSKVQDDSILNNKVLVLSKANGAKSDRYPIDAAIRSSMRGFWDMLLNNGLITKEKHARLIRTTAFTEDELHQFINRQLVETRQSTKAVAQLLKERYPDAEIVYVKAGLVSQFRQEFNMIKCRSVNDLHHAKDAYLNIVVGNVYHEKFDKRWFDVHQEYSLNLSALFGHRQYRGQKVFWQGKADIAKIQKYIGKNAVHLTRYAFCRKGGFFDQMPVKAGVDLVPLKSGLDTNRYGGYNKPTASFYMLAGYSIGGKRDVMFVPVELLCADRVLKDTDFARDYITKTVSKINSNKKVTDLQILLNGRIIKINTVIEADGMRMTLSGKTNKGQNIIVAANSPLVLGSDMERYVKRLERFLEKKQQNSGIRLNEQYDGITAEKNCALYDMLSAKLTGTIFRNCPGNIGAAVTTGRARFAELSPEEQTRCLMNIVSWFGSVQNCDLTGIGGKAKSGTKVPSAKLSNWAKNYADVRLIDSSASGLFESRSGNLLALL